MPEKRELVLFKPIWGSIHWQFVTVLRLLIKHHLTLFCAVPFVATFGTQCPRLGYPVGKTRAGEGGWPVTRKGNRGVGRERKWGGGDQGPGLTHPPVAQIGAFRTR